MPLFPRTRTHSLSFFFEVELPGISVAIVLIIIFVVVVVLVVIVVVVVLVVIVVVVVIVVIVVIVASACQACAGEAIFNMGKSLRVPCVLPRVLGSCKFASAVSGKAEKSGPSILPVVLWVFLSADDPVFLLSGEVVDA